MKTRNDDRAAGSESQGFAPQLTYLGGPTALLEIGGLRMLTDPTLDPAGTEYPTKIYTLAKTEGPALPPESLGRIDVVLLSHDHHFDNLDRLGRALLARVPLVLTTPVGAERLQGGAVGLATWESRHVPMAGGPGLQVTATPARHGPVGGDRGPVTGFVISLPGRAEGVIYISGDTVWYEGVEEVGRRFAVRTAVLFMGAARVKEVGPDHLTMTAAEGVQAARCFAQAEVIPLHCAGWRHFSESQSEIAAEFAAAGLEGRLRWAPAGRAMTLRALG